MPLRQTWTGGYDFFPANHNFCLPILTPRGVTGRPTRGATGFIPEDTLSNHVFPRSTCFAFFERSRLSRVLLEQLRTTLRACTTKQTSICFLSLGLKKTVRGLGLEMLGLLALIN